MGIQSAPTTASLRGIHFLGNGIAWSSGSSGTILRTTDDGAHWQLCATPPDAEKLDFRGIQAFDEDNAIVMSSGRGELSRLYKTTDGCQTWKLIFTNPDKEGFWDAIQFDQRNKFRSTSKYPNHGILVGDPVGGVFVIYESSDSGASWQRWEESGGAPPANMGHRSAKAANGEFLFAASNSALAVPGINGPFLFVTGGKGGSHLFISEPHSPLDNGTTWKFATISLPFKSSDSSGGFSVAARYSHGELSPDLMIVGGDYKEQTATKGTATFVRFHTSILDLFFEPCNHPPNPTPWLPLRSSLLPHPKSLDHCGSQRHRHLPRRRPQLVTPQTQPARPTRRRQNWDALSLPFVVGPHGRIGKINLKALAP